MRPRPGIFRRAGAVALLAMAAVASAGSAQTPGEVRSRCVDQGGALDRCANVALAARTIAGQTALLAGWGSEVPGSASTLGRKIGNTPRVATWIRAGGMSMGLPDVFDQGTGAAPEVTFFVPAVQAGLAAGLLDGFSPMPTMGGVLALDLFGSVGWVMPPSSQGFRGSVAAMSFGARVGVLRESFTLPGVSVSVSRRLIGEVGLGDRDLGDPARIDVDPAATSVRVTLGKDLYGVGVVGGIGWDDASADAVVEVPGPSAGSATVASGLDMTRRLYFASASLNYLLLQLTLEGGWAEGYPALSGSGGSAFDPTAGSAFGSLSLRFTP